MIDVLYRSVPITSEILIQLQDFSCGIGAMDDILHSQNLLAGLSENEMSAYFVYAPNGELIGFYVLDIIGLEIKDNDYDDFLNVVDIACLAVRKDYQRQGVGSAILKKIYDQAEQMNPQGLYLHVEALSLDDASYSAVPFYEKNGFIYIAPAGNDIIRMLYKMHSA